MIEIEIPQDIREFEPTLVGPLTTRQFLCLVIGGLATYGTYLLEKATGVDPMSYPAFILVAIPFFLVGWYKPYGMHFEKFVGKAFRENIMAPKNRKYIVDNMWDVIIQDEQKDSQKELEQEYRKARDQMTPEQRNERRAKERKKKEAENGYRMIPNDKLPPELKFAK